MFTVTNKWLEDNRTSAGGYNSPQIMALGWEDGLATTDWKSRSIGMTITLWQKRLFETLVKYKQSNNSHDVVKTQTKVKKKKIKQPVDQQAVQRDLQQRKDVLEQCRQCVDSAPW